MMQPAYGTRIDIVCSDPGHEGRRVKVTNFRFVDITVEYPSEFGDLDPYPWWEHDLAAREPCYGPYPTWELYERRAQEEILDGNVPMDDCLPGRPSHGWRTRYALHCRLCGLNLTINHDRLTSVLDRLAVAQVPSVELRHLVAILT